MGHKVFRNSDIYNIVEYAEDVLYMINLLIDNK